MRVLIVGCGPSGETWENYDYDCLIAVNSAIVPCADKADIFLVMENLGPMGDKKFPWIHTKTDALKIIDQKNLGPDRFDTPMTGDIQPVARNSRRPVTYPHSRVGTVLADALEYCHAIDADDVDTVGFPLYLSENNHHWTEPNKTIYRPLMSWYMKPEVFIGVRAGMLNPSNPDSIYKYQYSKTIWQWAMSAAYLRSVKYRFNWTDHSNGLLQIEGMENAMSCINDFPHDISV